MTEEQKKQIREARHILCPEDKKLRHAWLDSIKRFRDKYFHGYSVSTVRQLESSKDYKPSKRLQVLIDKALSEAEKKGGK